MNFNFQLNTLHSVNQTFIVLSIIIFFYYGNYNINWYDIYSRILGNEFYINLYYFLWTSFWYIPLLILLIIIWQFINYTNIKHTLLLVILLSILLNTIVDVHMYWVLNTNTYSLPLKSEHYNNLLLNSINKYHPGILYWTSLFIVVYWLMFNLYYLTFMYRFYTVTVELFIKPKFIWFSLVLLVTLGLGGWWALQEGSWGGWWNWDPSEVFGLLIFLFYLIHVHSKLGKQNFLNTWYYSITFCLLLLQVYFFTQLNFDLVSHNFGTKIDNFIDNTNLYTTIIIISYLVILRIWYLKFSVVRLLLSSKGSLYLQSVDLFKIYTLVILGLFLYELVYSLVPLFNDFLWKLLNINIANSILIFEKYNLEVVYLITLFFWNYSKLLTLFLIYNIWSYWVLLMVYVVIPRKATFLLHWLLSLFMWVSLLTLGYIFTEWSMLLTPYLNTVNIINTSVSQILLNVNNVSLDYTQTQYLFGEFWFSWNTIWIDTTPEVYSFLYYFTKDLSTQLMIIGSKLFTFSVNINDILSLNLIYIFISLITLYLYSFYTPKKIIF
jgi:hypothetical protein